MSKAASRSTFEELKFVNNTASNAGAFYYSPFSFSKLCRSDFFNNSCTNSNATSSLYLVINPNKEDIKSIKKYGDDDDDEDGKDEDDNDGEPEDDDEFDDAEENIKEDAFDNMTILNVALNDNIFKSEPIQNSTQVTIKLMKNANLSLGKNSFSFNEKDDEADELNSNYLRVIKSDDNSSSIAFRFDGFICLAGNSTGFEKVGVESIQSNCEIVKLNPDLDGESNRGSKNKKKKIILISGIVIGCIVIVAVVVVIILVAVPFMKKHSQYSTNLNSTGDSIVCYNNQETNEEIIPQL